MVFRGAAGVATRNTGRVECKSVTQGSGRMGRNVHLLPEVLAGLEFPRRPLPMVLGMVDAKVLAYRVGVGKSYGLALVLQLVLV